MVELADRVCDGKLVAIHEGGYSSSYVPFCGAAVIEGLLRIEESRSRTPTSRPSAAWSYMDLQPHQEEVIEAAATRLRSGAGRA